MALRRCERLHQVPAGEIRASDIAHLAAADEVVERRQRFLDRGVVVLAVQLQQIDMIDAKPVQRGIDRLQDMLTRRAELVGTRPHGERRLGRDQQAVPLASDGFAKNLLGQSVGIGVGAIEQADAMIETDVDQPGSALAVGGAPRLEEIVAAAEGRGPEAQGGDTQSRVAEAVEVHGALLISSPRMTRSLVLGKSRSRGLHQPRPGTDASSAAECS